MRGIEGVTSRCRAYAAGVYGGMGIRSSLVACALALVVAGCGDDATPTLDAAVSCTTDVQCSDGVHCNGTERCLPGDPLANTFGCVAGSDPCAGIGACLEVERACDDSCATPDGDADGADRIECGGDDCDDTDAERYPGNAEICDTEGHDEDCDLNTVGALDRDRDGFIDARCFNEGGAAGTDCNDLEVTVSPVAPETCNGRDDDCDGDVDEGVTLAGFVDADADGRGDDGAELNACPGAARFALIGADCDDADLSVQPVQNEICDAKDNDCDGIVDEDARPAIWYEDADGDGYGDARGTRVTQCVPPPSGYSLLPTDCAPDDPDRSPVAVEVCNGLDDDCNGVADFAAAPGDFEDDDGDGVPDASCGGGDCDDLDPFVGAGLPEYCNGRDDDCDGMIDEELTESDFYVDRDGDGYGVGAAMPLCTDVPGLAPRAGDCDDLDPGTTLGARERCDGIDNDCDGTIDEDAAESCFGPNATYLCVAGACEVATCTGSYGDCDGRASTGCEEDLTTDGAVPHCGQCGVSCAACTAGVCPAAPTRVTLDTTVLLPTAAMVPGVPAVAPETAPLRSGVSDMDGRLILGLPGPTPVVVGGAANLVPTVFDVGPTGPTNRARMFVQFLRPVGVMPLTGTERLAAEALAGTTQRAGMGMVAVEVGITPVTPTPVTLDLPSDPPLGFERARPLSASGGAAIDGTTQMLLFLNVEPGPVRASGSACRTTSSPGRVYPGALTVIVLDCAP